MKGNSVKFMPGSGPAVPQECSHCGSGFTMGGPFWAEPLHDRAAIAAVLTDLDVIACPCKLFPWGEMALSVSCHCQQLASWIISSASEVHLVILSKVSHIDFSCKVLLLLFGDSYGHVAARPTLLMIECDSQNLNCSGFSRPALGATSSWRNSQVMIVKRLLEP